VQPVGQHPSPLAPEQMVIGVRWQRALHWSGEPVSFSRVQASPSSGQVVGQLPGGSQVSPIPMRPSLHRGAQSLSSTAVHAAGQHPSPLKHAVMRMCEHVRVHASTDPLATSIVHASWSLHDAAQAPGLPAVIRRSQLSAVPTTLSPQITEQSESLAVVHPAGQQPSPDAHPVIGEETHRALHIAASPCSSTDVQVFAMLGQSVGHEPSMA
jgi:hypothetical protein